MSEQDRSERSPPPGDAEGGSGRSPDGSRRALIKNLGLAAAVAPAMVVLLEGESRATPACDNPAWQHGLSRKGHSGC